MKINLEEVRARALHYEREGILIYWTAWALIPVAIAILVLNLLLLHDPLLIAGTSLAILVPLLIAGAIVRNRPARISKSEACFDFLRRVLEAKRRGAVFISWSLVLAVPAIACCWAARPSRPPWAFAIVIFGVVFCWWAFRHEARRFQRELDRMMP